MSRRPGADSRTLVASTALAVLLSVSLAGCSGDDKSAPKNGGSSGGTNSPVAPKDESASVLGWSPPTAVAKAEGKLAPRVNQGATVPATAEIISVKASEASTILTWQLSSATDISAQGVTLNSIHGARFWPDAVRLVDAVGKKSYAVDSMKVAEYTYCVCSSYPIHVGPVPVRMTSEYPPLLATATSITVQIPHFAPVTVPVSR